MPRFTAIDGLRAWLAWTVALSHIAQESGFRYSHGLLLKMFEAGNWGVQTFIIISGFVITHLLIEKQEPYRIYIIRRFMRLFPAFIFCCFLGAISYRVANEIGEYSWFQSENAELFQSQQHFLLANILAHLTMLHGIIPNDLLMLSEYNFLPPAWSVSLEWQFYIIAPFVILLCRSRIGSVILVLITVASMIAYGRWLSPHWRQPSIIVGQASFFLIGIGSRFAAPRLLGVVVAPTATALAFASAAIMFRQEALAAWVIIYIFMISADSKNYGIDRTFINTVKMLTESKAAQFLGARSYSTYLLHVPVIIILAGWLTGSFHLQGIGLFAALLIALPTTFALQEPIYRWIERPGQLLARRWAKKLSISRTIERYVD